MVFQACDALVFFNLQFVSWYFFLAETASCWLIGTDTRIQKITSLHWPNQWCIHCTQLHFDFTDIGGGQGSERVLFACLHLSLADDHLAWDTKQIVNTLFIFSTMSPIHQHLPAVCSLGWKKSLAEPYELGTNLLFIQPKSAPWFRFLFSSTSKVQAVLQSTCHRLVNRRPNSVRSSRWPFSTGKILMARQILMASHTCCSRVLNFWKSELLRTSVTDA